MEIIHHHFDVIDSTNTWVKTNAKQLSRSALTIVTADLQTAGRGRFKNIWQSPGGINLYVTFGLFRNKNWLDSGQLAQLLAISVIESLETCGFRTRIKWPNDLLLSGKKIAGILCETVDMGDSLCIILGLGLNINMSTEHFQGINKPATSLFLEDGQMRNVQEVLKTITTFFLNNIETLLHKGMHSFFPLQQYFCHQIGSPLSFAIGPTLWQGVFAGITEQGALIMDLPSGEQKIFTAGVIE